MLMRKKSLTLIPLGALLLTALQPTAAASDIKAVFSASQCELSVYYNGFDSDTEFSEWTHEGEFGGWKLSSQPYGNGAPAFSAINPDSKSSLYFPRIQAQRDEAVISPGISIRKGDKLSFWSATNPIWLVYARTKLIILDGENETTLWDNFLWNQFNPTDDTKWVKFDYPLDDFAGKDIRLKYLYTGADGEPVMIDDVRISRTDHSEDAKVSIAPGETIDFLDLSEGDIATYHWSFPGGVPETSSSSNPTVSYPSPGVYDVTLEVTAKDGSTSISTRKGFVTVTAKALEAAIGIPAGVYHSPEANIVVPLFHELTFTDATDGEADSREWLFPGTATPTSEDVSPTVYYTSAGLYDIDLSVTNSAGTSATYLHGVLAGTQALAWNIPAKENTALAPVNLGWYGYYGGTNWLDMPAFAEYFSAPLEPVEITEINVYFAAATISDTSKDLPLTVSVCRSENGLPGSALASASMPCSDLVDASQTVNDPTTFYFDDPVTVTDDFFITIGEFPNNEGDDIAMYCSPRREDLSNSTVYHLLLDLDEQYRPTGTSTWVKNSDEALSFAIAPKIEFHKGSAAIGIIEESPSEATDGNGFIINPDEPAEYYSMSGLTLPGRPSMPGIYLVRQGTHTGKIIIR